MKTYTLEPTSHPDLFRVVDREGDWTHYYHAPRDRYLPAVNFRLTTGYAKDKPFFDWLKSKTGDEADRILKAAGERGDRVHQFIRYVFTPTPNNLSGSGSIAGVPILDRHTKVFAEDNKTQVQLSNDEWDCILSFQEFWKQHDAVLIAYEIAAFDLTKAGCYAGTLDALIRLRKECGSRYCKCKAFIGKLGIIDWKSGGGIYQGHGAQVASYAKAESLKEVLGKHKIDYTAIVRIGTKHKNGGYQFEPYDQAETDVHWGEFQAAVQISNAYVKPFDAAQEIYEIPDELTLTIEREELVKPKAKRTPAKGKKPKVVKKQPS